MVELAASILQAFKGPKNKLEVLNQNKVQIHIFTLVVPCIFAMTKLVVILKKSEKIITKKAIKKARPLI